MNQGIGQKKKNTLVLFHPPGFSESRRKFLLCRGSSYSLVELPTFLSIEQDPEPQPTLSQVLSNYNPASPRPMSQWTVLIFAFIFFICCILLVATTLSVTSKYQDTALARLLNTTSDNNKSTQDTQLSIHSG